MALHCDINRYGGNPKATSLKPPHQIKITVIHANRESLEETISDHENAPFQEERHDEGENVEDVDFVDENSPSGPENTQQPEQLEAQYQVPRKTPQGRRNQTKPATQMREGEQPRVDPGIFNEVNTSGKQMTPQSQAANRGQGMTSQGQGGIQRDKKSEPLRLRLDVNLDLDLELRARVHGDITLALL